MSLVMRNQIFAYAKTKTQISFAVIAKLISVFVFATQIVQSLYYLNPKFQASSHLLWLCSLVCIGPGRKPRRPVFSEQGSNVLATRQHIDCTHFSKGSRTACLVVLMAVYLLLQYVSRRNSIYLLKHPTFVSCHLTYTVQGLIYG